MKTESKIEYLSLLHIHSKQVAYFLLEKGWGKHEPSLITSVPTEAFLVALNPLDFFQ